MGVCLIWLSEAEAVETVVADPGPWREIRRIAPGLLLAQTDDSVSRVHHEVKWRIGEGCALLVAPLTARPKARGLEAGSVSWMRSRLPLPQGWV